MFAVACCLLVGLAGCSGQQNVKAKIFERKHLSANKLLVKYTYKVEDKVFTDSAEIDNQVLTSDTITVSFRQNKPAESSPENIR